MREGRRGRIEGGGGVSAPVRDRLQHASFDRMAPPGAENTKPCDYPKHTGSNWVSEPALFPTRLLWSVWVVRLSSAILLSLPSSFLPWSQKLILPRTFCHLDATGLSSTSLLLTQKQKMIWTCWHALASPDSWTLGKCFCGFQSKLDFLSRLRAGKHHSWKDEIWYFLLSNWEFITLSSFARSGHVLAC